MNKITAVCLLAVILTPTVVWADLPDTISDTGTREAVEYLDNKITSLTTDVNTLSGAVPSTSTTLAVANGGTGATNASTARSNLGVAAVDGSNAAGTWPISISGTAASAASASTAGSATYATTAGTAAYSVTSAYATNVGTAAYSVTSSSSNFAVKATSAAYAAASATSVNSNYANGLTGRYASYYSIPYQDTSYPAVTTYFQFGSNNTVLTSQGITSAPVWTTMSTSASGNTLVLRDSSGNITANTVTAYLSGNAATATNATTAVRATNIAGGAKYSIPYQSAAGTTAFLDPFETGDVMLSGYNTTAPTWTTPTSSNDRDTLVLRDATGSFSAGIVSVSTLTVVNRITANYVVSSTISATKYYGDGSALTGITASGIDTAVRVSTGILFQQDKAIGVATATLRTDLSAETSRAIARENEIASVSTNIVVTNGLTAVGIAAGESITTGDTSVFIGHAAGASNTTGSSNTYVGAMSGTWKDPGGVNNTFLGAYSGGGNTGSYNTVLGAESGLYYEYNVDRGQLLGGVNTSSNTLVGYKTGTRLTGGGNVIIGYQSGTQQQTEAENILIGYQVNVPYPNYSHYLNIGNTITGDMVSTGTMTFITAVQARKFVGDGSLLTNLSYTGTDAAVRVSTGILTVNLAAETTNRIAADQAIGVTTGSLHTELTAESGARLSSDQSIGLATGTLRTDLNSVILSTSPLANAANWNLAYAWGNHATAGYASAATLTDVATSTGAIQTSLNSVITSTGLIASNLSTETSNRISADQAIGVSTGQLQQDLATEVSNRGIADQAIILSTAPLKDYASWNLAASSITYWNGALRPTGDGSGLSGVLHSFTEADPLSVKIAGDTMTGPLTLRSTITVTGSAGVYGMQVSSNVSLGGVLYTKDGGVAIGTTDPLGGKLYVSGASGGALATFNATSGNAGMYLTAASNGASEIHLTHAAGNPWHFGLDSSGHFNFVESGVAERLTILPGGNMGISNTGPTYRLDVSGTGHYTGALTVDGAINGSGASLTGIPTLAQITSIGVATASLRTDLAAVTLSTAPLKDYANWNNAYSWGNPSGVYLPIGGTAVKASALAAAGTTCTGTQAATGVDAAGNAVGCWTPSSGGSTGDNLGDHVATMTITAGYGIAATTITVSDSVRAVKYLMDDYTPAIATKGSADSFAIAGAALTGSGSGNLFMGVGTGADNTGNNNIMLGFQSGVAANSGADNVFIGDGSGYYNASGYNNIFVGVNAAYANNSGSNNLIMGPNAGASLSAGNNNILLGVAADTTDADYYLNIGNSITGAMTLGSTMTFITAIQSPKFIGKYATLDGSLTAANIQYTAKADYSGNSITPDCAYNVFFATAATGTTTINNPACTPTKGQRFILRIKDDGSARTLTWGGSQYRAGTIALPTATTVSKNMYLGFLWNSYDSKWDLIAYSDGF